MPLEVVDDPNGLRKVLLSEPGGSSVEVLLHGGQIVSWKNDRREELLFVRSKNTGKSPLAIFGGISIRFPQHEYTQHRLWSLENDPLVPNCSHSSVNLILQSTDKDLKAWPCRFELRLSISVSPRKLTLMPSVRNTGNKPFSFTFAMRNHLSVSDISEVRVEGLETLDYLDNNAVHKRRFTEQADALTFDGEINRTYLNTPPKIAVIDHGKKRTFVLRKQGLPDAVVWCPGDKPGKNIFNNNNIINGDDSKKMVSFDSSVFDKPIVLKPLQLWRGLQEILTVSSSYCSGQLDPNINLLQGIIIS